MTGSFLRRVWPRRLPVFSPTGALPLCPQMVPAWIRAQPYRIVPLDRRIFFFRPPRDGRMVGLRPVPHLHPIPSQGAAPGLLHGRPQNFIYWPACPSRHANFTGAFLQLSSRACKERCVGEIGLNKRECGADTYAGRRCRGAAPSWPCNATSETCPPEGPAGEARLTCKAA